jgi:Flp pilus assembly pilin Flp
MIERALISVFVALAILAALGTVGERLQATFCKVGAALHPLQATTCGEVRP